MPADDRGVLFERLVQLEGVVRQQGSTQGDYGGVLDHLVNTMDSIVLPTQASHTSQLVAQQRVLDEHAKTTAEAHDYIMSQRGAWAFVQRVLLVVAALSGVVTLAMNVLKGHIH